MPTPDELLLLVDRILNWAGEDHSALERWSRTEDGQKVIQYVIQIGKYPTNIGEGQNISIGDRMDRKLLEEIRDLLQAQIAPPPLEINWQQVSRQLLEERLQLTTNPMTRGEDIAYRVEQVYVPLGLVERKKVPRRKEDVSPERGSALYQEGQEQERSALSPGEESPQGSELVEEVEVTQKFEHEQFLEQVLQQGQSPKSQGKRIAIIGEPGAGKTTLLQQVAQWTLEKFPESIVIWVSLADLQRDTLETYLEKRWLQRVIREAGGVEPSQADKTNFAAQFKQGRIWLLLDGLDEMQVAGNPLSEIQRQIQEGGWLQQARILLTCRLNLWDGNRNSLDQFDTYRTLEFAYPNQVEQFIEQWFAPRKKADLGLALCTALRESGRERIRDLVKNPLRLTLMCFSWYLQQGQLPETRAELYQRFVDRIYEWKQEQFPTTLEQREQLNQALAELSIAAIDDADTQRQTRFRLRQAFVSRFLKQSALGGEQTLFDLALKVGWLNQVGVDADDPTQTVYAFYHPTFEEYFAALGIDDGRFFLNPVPRNPTAKEASYRVFEPQWRQVFLLWLGCKDERLKPTKEALIQALKTFKDGCDGFYSDQAFLLATVGISEFKDSAYANEIVNQLIRWKFSNSNWLERSRVTFIAPARTKFRIDRAEMTFSNTDPQRVIRALVQMLETTQDQGTRLMTACSLGKIDPGNETAIRALMQVLETTQNEYNRWMAAYSLGKIDPGNEIAIRTLVKVLETTQNKHNRWMATRGLNEIGGSNETAIQELVRVLETAQDEDTHWEATLVLGKIDPSNEIAIRALVQVLATAQDKNIRWQAVTRLCNLGAGNETAIQELVGVLETTQDEDTYCEATLVLSKIDPSNETAIRALVQVLETARDKNIRWQAAMRLGEIGTGNETAIQELVRVLETAQDKDTCQVATYSLEKIGTGNNTAIQELVRVLETAQDKDTRWRIAKSLGKIDPNSRMAIQALVSVLETAQNKDIYWNAIHSLKEIGAGNETAIQELVSVLEITQDKDIRWGIAYILGRIDPGNEMAVQAVARMIETAQDEDTRWRAAYTLGEIGIGNETAIRMLVQVLKTTQDESIRWIVAHSLGEIGVSNETTIWALVQILKTTQDEYIFRTAIKSLGKLGIGNEVAIQALVQILKTTQNEEIYWVVAGNLAKINPSNQTAIQALVKVLETTQHKDIRWKAAEILSETGTGNETGIHALERVLKTARDECILLAAAESLGRIDPGNEMAIQRLIWVLRITQSDITRWHIIHSLNKISGGDKRGAIQALVWMLKTSQDEDTRLKVAESLIKIDRANRLAIRALVRILKTTQNKDTRWRAVENLVKVDPGNETAIRALVKVLESTQDEDTRWSTFYSLGEIGIHNEMSIRVLVQSLRRNLRTKEAYQLMMTCAETIPYKEFYRAFHSLQ